MSSSATPVTETVAHGAYTAAWRKNPLNAVPYLDCIEKIEKRVDGDFKLANILPFFTDDTVDDLRSRIKKAVRRNERKTARFAPTGVQKPRPAIRLFQIDDLAKCAAEDRKGYIKNGLLSKHWKALSQKERDGYETRAKAEKASWDAEYKRQLASAIETGAWQEPKPKRAMSAYFHFSMSAEIMAECQKQGLKGIQRSTLVSARWKALSAEQRKAYEDMNAKDKLRFDADMVKYNERADARKAGKAVPAPVVAPTPTPSVASSEPTKAPKKEKTAAEPKTPKKEKSAGKA